MFMRSIGYIAFLSCFAGACELSFEQQTPADAAVASADAAEDIASASVDIQAVDLPQTDAVQNFEDAWNDDAELDDANSTSLPDAWTESDAGECAGLAWSETRIRGLMEEFQECLGDVDCTVLMPSLNCNGTTHNPDQLVAVNASLYAEASAALEAATPALCDAIGECMQHGDYLYPGVTCNAGRCVIDMDACPSDLPAAAGWWCPETGTRCESAACGNPDLCATECQVLTCGMTWMIEYGVCE